WTHQPGGDLRVVPGEEGVAHPGAALHHRAVPRRHLRRRPCQGLPELLLRAVRRWRQRAQRRLLQGHRSSGRDHRHLRARLHGLLRHRPKRNARDSHIPVLALSQSDSLCSWSTWPPSPSPAPASTPREAWELLSSTTLTRPGMTNGSSGPLIGAAIAAAYHQYVLRASAAKLGSYRSN
ncbi:hypothetical protein ZWY2020_051674, partial [Hordeum vulgare]